MRTRRRAGWPGEHDVVLALAQRTAQAQRADPTTGSSRTLRAHLLFQVEVVLATSAGCRPADRACTRAPDASFEGLSRRGWIARSISPISSRKTTAAMVHSAAPPPTPPRRRTRHAAAEQLRSRSRSRHRLAQSTLHEGCARRLRPTTAPARPCPPRSRRGSGWGCPSRASGAPAPRVAGSIHSTPGRGDCYRGCSRTATACRRLTCRCSPRAAAPHAASGHQRAW